MPPTPSAAETPPGSEEPPSPSEFPSIPRPWPGLDRPGLDRLGLTQAIGGLALGLIALFSSYDHLTIAGRNLPIPQQWGIPLIAASVAIVFIDAQLATGSRLRAAQDAARMEDEANRRENEADRRENEAARERIRAAEARERQAQDAQCQNAALDLLRRSAVLSARVQLDPSDINRARLQTFLALIAGEIPPEEQNT